MSAWGAAKVGDHAKHGILPEGRERAMKVQDVMLQAMAKKSTRASQLVNARRRQSQS